MHPIIFQTEHISLHTIWIFITAAIIVSTYTTIKLSIKNSLKIQFLSEISWKLILLGFVGARITSIFIHYQTYFYEFSTDAVFRLFYFWDKGLNFWGALIAIFIYLFYACKKNEQDFYKWLDVLIPSIILGLAITHIGAFFEGVNYGKETSLPWGVNFESPAIKYTVPIHPTQIYATIYSLVLATLLIIFSKSKKYKNMEKTGLVGILGIGSYSFFRFLEEFLRGDDSWLILGIRVPQIIALIITISAGIFLYLRYNPSRKRKKSKK